MLRFWQVLLYFNMILLAQCASNSENPTHLVVTLSSTNDLNDDDDDYYSDNEPSDSIGSDYDALKYLYVKWVKPSPYPSTTTPPSTHLNPPTSTTSTSQHLKRVPRHPHHVWNDNRVDGDAAFDEEGYQSDQAVGVLTAQKQQEVGTQENVYKSRRIFQERSRNTTLRDMANSHQKRIENEARCKWPQPRVIHINNETSKQYAPRATILHRCDDTTGCCPEAMVCTVKKGSEITVELPFWVRTGSGRSQPQMVPLTNHTECECVDLAAQRRKRSSQCQCPKHFTNFSNVIWHRGVPATSCRCDCHLSDATCQRMKNGEEGFAMSERRCILRNECSQPICNFGLYSPHSGRCPRPLQQQQQQQRQLGFG